MKAEPKYDIHTNLSKESYKFLHELKEKYGLYLSEVIDVLISHYKNSNKEMNQKILDAVIDEVITRYYLTITTKNENTSVVS